VRETVTVKRNVLVSAAVIVLAVVAVLGAYLTVYEPSHQPILNGPKPIPANKQAMMPVTPLGELPGPDATRVAGTLRGAAESVLPGFRIDDEALFSHPGGWDALRKLTGEYLGDEFGLRQQVDADMQFDGHPFRYLVWGTGWPRSLFDDRRVVAVEYFEPLTPDNPESMLGYFVMQPK